MISSVIGPRIRRPVTLACLLGLTGAAVTAGEPLTFERFGPEHGLPHNTVNEILQDRQGFLWLATDGGLSRYDGYGFVNHRIEPALGASNVLMALLEDSDGHLWVGSETGLWRFDRGAGEFLAAALEGAPEGGDAYTEALLEDGSGRLWAGVGGALYRREPAGSTFRRVDVPGSPFEQIWSLAETSAGELWAVVGDGEAVRLELRRVNGGGDGGDSLPIDEEYHTKVLVDSADRFWIGRVDAGAAPGAAPPLLDRACPPGPAATYLNDLFELDDGSFWLACSNGLYRLDAETGSRVRHPLHHEAPSWQSEQARSVLVDRAGGLWVGTLGGLFHHDPHLPKFRHWRHDPRDPSSLSAAPISDIVGGPDGALWIGTFGGGINRVDPASGRAESFRHDPADPASIPRDVVWALTWDVEDRLWVGVASPTVFDPRTGRFERLEDDPDAVDPDVLYGDDHGRVWLGSFTEGLAVHRLDDRSWHRLPELDTFQIVPGGDGVLWLGGTGSVTRLETSSLETETFPLRSTAGGRLADVQVLDLHEQAGSLWLATTAGLGRVDPGGDRWELPLAAEELPGTVVFSIQPDPAGRLWLGTNQGLARFDPAAKPGRRVRTYDLGDGVGSVEFNRHSRYRAADGTIYMGGMNGVTVFRPDEIRDNPFVPPVVLTEVLTLGEAGEARLDPRGLEELELAPGVSEVTFSFTAIGFTRAERNRYAYRLEGFDSGWIDGGTERSARYTNVPPGSYRFRVRGSNNDGVWNEAGASLPVEVLPAVWQTSWFKLLVAALVVAGLTIAYRLRVRRLLELERMRLRIAGDLHDELGSELSGIALATSRLAGKEYLQEADRERLDDVRASSVQVMQGLRDIVWYVNPDHDTMRSIEARMRSAAAFLLGGIEHRFEADLPDDGSGIDMATRRGLYLIYKELLTNAARHSGASEVRIRLATGAGELLLEVADDGAGFDPGSESDGSGLAGIRRRAARLGASLEIDSRPGAGCRARVRAKMTRTRHSRRRRRPPTMIG